MLSVPETSHFSNYTDVHIDYDCTSARPDELGLYTCAIFVGPKATGKIKQRTHVVLDLRKARPQLKVGEQTGKRRILGIAQENSEKKSFISSDPALWPCRSAALQIWSNKQRSIIELQRRPAKNDQCSKLVYYNTAYFNSFIVNNKVHNYCTTHQAWCIDGFWNHVVREQTHTMQVRIRERYSQKVPVTVKRGHTISLTTTTTYEKNLNRQTQDCHSDYLLFCPFGWS